MLLFFDYLYYFLLNRFSESKKEGAEGKACSAVTGLQVFNIYSIALIIENITKANLSVSKLYILFLFASLLVFNYLRFVYFDSRELAIKNNWESKADSDKLSYNNLFRTYISLSFILFFGLIIYFSRKGN